MRRAVVGITTWKAFVAGAESGGPSTGDGGPEDGLVMIYENKTDCSACSA